MFASFTPDSAHALLLADGVLNRIVAQQALTIAFDDVFRLMAWLFVAALMLVPFLRHSSGGGARQADAH
jgi:MFS transporter, DHA2 family, multidrug resistance protein